MRRAPLIRDAVTPDLLAKIARLIELNHAHMRAIQGGPQDFYEDGRHTEMCALGAEVRAALGIKPWDDEGAILREALRAAR